MGRGDIDDDTKNPSRVESVAHLSEGARGSHTMTISSQQGRQAYAGAGTTGPFAVPFKFFADTDLKVVKQSADGIDSTLTLNVDYTLTGAGSDSGGSLTTTANVAVGETLNIILDPELKQPTDYVSNDAFAAESHERALDRLTQQNIRTRDIVSRGLRQADGDFAEIGPLPGKSIRANMFIAFDSNGDPIASSGTGADAGLRTDLASTTVSNDGALLVGYRRTETGSVARSVRDVLSEVISVTDFGADPTGTNDSTDAFNAAVDAAEATFNNTVHVPHGIYRIEGTVTIHQGVTIKGQGSQGSTTSYGTVIRHRANSAHCFVWDGNGTSFAGTGGGLRDMLIVKDTGFTGGYAAHIVATDDNHRPGEMLFQNVLIYASGTGQWERAFNIDGTACNTPGAKGVRDMGLYKLRVSGCSDNNKYINISQVVHIHGSYIEIDTGNGTGTTGMTIDGDSTGVCWSSIEINGSVVVDGNASNVNLQGHISTLDVNNTSCVGSFHGSIGSALTNASKFFKISSNLADAFFAYRTGAASNVTGDGTAYTVICDNERFDKNSGYDTSTGIFTAKCAGLYMFCGSVVYSGLGASHNGGKLDLIHRDSGGSLQNEVEVNVNPGAIRNGSNQASQNISAIFDLAENDTVRLVATVSGDTKTVNVTSGSSVWNTYFMGKLLS
jgi:hypothetical protein